MVKLRELANVIRSKNAGPYLVTLDIIFSEWEDYYRVRDDRIIDQSVVKRLYNVDDDDIVYLGYYDPSKAIKITLKREVTSGSIGDGDVQAMQQHRPLLDINIPD